MHKIPEVKAIYESTTAKPFFSLVLSDLTMVQISKADAEKVLKAFDHATSETSAGIKYIFHEPKHLFKQN